MEVIEETHINRNRIEELVSYLEVLPAEEFDYNYFFLDAAGKPVHFNDVTCGTRACVAGHTMILFRHLAEELLVEFSGMPFTDRLNFLTPGNIAQEILGLSREAADLIFYHNSESSGLHDAIRRLKYLLDHNTVDGYGGDENASV